MLAATTTLLVFIGLHFLVQSDAYQRLRAKLFGYDHRKNLHQ